MTWIASGDSSANAVVVNCTEEVRMSVLSFSSRSIENFCCSSASSCLQCHVVTQLQCKRGWIYGQVKGVIISIKYMLGR